MEWQPIETAPKDGTEVLLCGPLRDGSGHYRDVSRFYMIRWPVEWMANCLPPTHWMPLPPPPAD